MAPGVALFMATLMMLASADPAPTVTEPKVSAPTPGPAAQDPKQDPPEEPLETAKGLRLIVRSDGLQHVKMNTKDTAPKVQHMWVTEDRLLFRQESPPVNYLLRLDENPPQIWEITGDRKQYRNAAPELDKIQRRRRTWERTVLETQKGEPGFERFLKENHIHPKGLHLCETEVKAVEEKVHGFTVKRYQVRENGQLVVDTLVTEELGMTIPFFDFYERLGAFSDEVLKELRKIRGVPLQAKFVVVTELVNYPVESLTLEVAPRDIPLALFELPEGATEVKEQSVVACPHCGKQVEKENPGAKYYAAPSFIFFCSKEHRKIWVQENVYGKKNKASSKTGKSGKSGKTGTGK